MLSNCDVVYALIFIKYALNELKRTITLCSFGKYTKEVLTYANMDTYERVSNQQYCVLL